MPPTDLLRPTVAQQRWIDLKFGMFVHFGINTYYDSEWSDGTLDPSRFNPTQLDTDQWCRVAEAAGMNYIVLITKHHDEFIKRQFRELLTGYGNIVELWFDGFLAKILTECYHIYRHTTLRNIGAKTGLRPAP